MWIAKNKRSGVEQPVTDEEKATYEANPFYKSRFTFRKAVQSDGYKMPVAKAPDPVEAASTVIVKEDKK